MADPNVAPSYSAPKKKGGSRGRPMRRPTKRELLGTRQRSMAAGKHPTEATILATWRRSHPVTAGARKLTAAKPGSGTGGTGADALAQRSRAGKPRPAAPAANPRRPTLPASIPTPSGGTGQGQKVKPRRPQIGGTAQATPRFPLPPGAAKKQSGGASQSARPYAPGQQFRKPGGAAPTPPPRAGKKVPSYAPYLPPPKQSIFAAGAGRKRRT